MSSDHVLDLDRLLAPLSDEAPAGIDLRTVNDSRSNDTKYGSIRSVHKAARTTERRRESAYDDAQRLNEIGWPDWTTVKNQALAALEQTRDVDIAACLLDALVREHGIAALVDGLRMIRGWVEQYWDALYPTLHPGEEPVEKIAILGGVLESLHDALSNVPLSSGGAATYMGYLQAHELENETDPVAKEEKLSRGAYSLSQFEGAIRNTPAAALTQIHADLQRAAEEVRAFQDALATPCGDSVPAFPLLLERLDDIRRALSSYLTVETDAEEPAPFSEENDSGDVPPSSTRASSGAGSGPIRSRVEAFARLREVADYLKRTEPHSPTAYAVEQAIYWGNLPLPQLLADLIPEDAILRQIRTRLGIRDSDSET